MSVSIIIPVYNENLNVATLAKAFDQIKETVPISEVIWINDGSTDNTLEIIRTLCDDQISHKFIDLSRNFGQQIAIQAGLDFCSGKYAVIMDGDGQDPPELIEALYKKILTGFDVVYARRVNREGESWVKKKTASWFYKLMDNWVSFKLPRNVGDFRICSRKVIEAIKRMPERNKFIRGQMAWIGFKQTYLDYHRPPRLKGTSHYPTKKMWRLAWDAITAYTDFPLKLITWLGITVTVFAFLVMLYALYSRYILNDFVQGWTSLMIAVMFVGGIQMIAIGIIGAYMHRTHQNTLQRPLYFINEQNVRLPK